MHTIKKCLSVNNRPTHHKFDLVMMTDVIFILINHLICSASSTCTK